MATLPAADIDTAWREWMEDNEEPCSFDKNALKAAAVSLDNWLDTNATALNNVLNAAFRTAASQKQKARLLWYVVRRRYDL